LGDEDLLSLIMNIRTQELLAQACDVPTPPVADMVDDFVEGPKRLPLAEDVKAAYRQAEKGHQETKIDYFSAIVTCYLLG